MKGGRFVVDIKELVLVGFEGSVGVELSEALSEALTRAFAEQGLPPGWTDSEAAENLCRDYLRLDVREAGTNSPAVVADSLVQALYAVPTGTSGGQS